MKHKTVKKQSVDQSIVDTAMVARHLSRWFLKNARVLPWRENPEPYFVWLSEVMLQQTQVTAVIPYFNRFTRKFPTVGHLSRASIDEVYSLWAGLGYYSRARNLHKGAQAIQDRLDQGFGFPGNREEWLAIPGVGEYTAGAICSIAHNQRESIVDGNVVRVLSRVFSIGKIDARKSEIWERAKELVEVKGVEPRVLNQAIMELGALVCKPKNPKCEECPLQSDCLGQDHPELFPPPKKKKAWKHVKEECWVLVHGKKIFLMQNHEAKWRKGLWDFPISNSFRLAKAKLLQEKVTRYVVTNHKVERTHLIFEVDATSAEKIKKLGTWFEMDKIPGVPAPVKKLVAQLDY